MCGLFGIAAREGDIDLDGARHARDKLTHRGPDQAGEWLADGLYMGHRRLSIIDISEQGRQPMTSARAAISVNGEIYNFAALREELERAGYKFRSRSDSEVVLHGYEEWGVDKLVNRLEGMYAVVIYDIEARKLVMFRDRCGVKPLYYGRDGDRLIWASELKAIRAFDDGWAVDAEAALDFLVYRYIPAPKSIFRGISKLPAASILECTLDDMRVTTRRYWRLETDATAAADGNEARTLALLDEAVRTQLVSDVPLGMLLSGGLDSSAVTSFAADHIQGLQTFSIGFPSMGRDESPIARAMAAHAGTEHYVRNYAEEDVGDIVSRMGAWFDEPFSDTSALPTHRVCAFARETVTVALSGDGGDELFGGYRWYDRYNGYRARARPGPRRGLSWPFAWRRQAIELGSTGDPLWLYARLRGAISPRALDRWRKRLGVRADYDPLWAYRAAYRPQLSPRRAAQVMDFHTYLPDDILTKVDRVSMAVSLECRPALLYTPLVELAFSLPDAFTYLGDELKGGLRTSLRPRLPTVVAEHAKQGFSIPNAGWREELERKHGSVSQAMLAPFVDGRS